MDSPRTGQGQMDAEGARQQAAACRGRVERALSTVLQAAVERGYLEKNPAHGIRIRGANAKTERRFYSPVQVRQLLAELTEPCRSIVLLAVLTGMRIGEILALRWKRLDLLRAYNRSSRNFFGRAFRLAEDSQQQSRDPDEFKPSATCLMPIAPGGANRAGRFGVLHARRAHRSIRKTSTTARSHPHVIGSNSQSLLAFLPAHPCDTARRVRRITQDRAGASGPFGP